MIKSKEIVQGAIIEVIKADRDMYFGDMMNPRAQQPMVAGSNMNV